MRDRLIELIKRDNCRNPFNCSSQCTYVESDDCHSERLADLILADGWIRPPCKVGQIVYRVYWNNSIDTCRVSALTQKSDKSWKIRVTSGINKSVFEITPDRLGKTVFLTREQAEAKLKEEKG